MAYYDQNPIQPPAGATYISDPNQLAGLSESQIWRQPGTNKIFKLAGTLTPLPMQAGEGNALTNKYVAGGYTPEEAAKRVAELTVTRPPAPAGATPPSSLNFAPTGEQVSTAPLSAQTGVGQTGQQYPQQGTMQGFQGAMNTMLSHYKNLGPLQDQKRLLLQQLYDQPLTPEQLRTLSPAQQEAIRNGDKKNIEYQIMTLNDVLKGRGDEFTTAMQYMSEGYKTDQAALEKKRQTAYDNFSTMVNKYPDVAAAMSPEGFAAFQRGEMPPAEDVQKVYAAYKTSLAAEKSGGVLTMKDALTLAAQSMDPQATMAALAPYIGKTSVEAASALAGGGFTSSGGVSSSGGRVSVGGHSYDMSTYAADPSYVASLGGIVDTMGQMTSPEQVSQYIQSKAPNSPVTFAMIQNASQQNGIPWEMLMGVMQKESTFGTSPVATKNNNPGGITWSQSYQDSHPGTSKGTARPANEGGYYVRFNSMADGVNAVAQQIARREVQGGGQTQTSGLFASLAKAKSGSAMSGTDVDAIAKAVENGTLPPEMTGFGMGGAGKIKAALAKDGYDLTKATLDWKGTQKYVQTLNGAQYARLRDAIGYVYNFTDVVSNLNQQWKRGNFGPFNHAQLKVAESGAMGPEAQSIATQFLSSVATFQGEMAVVLRGGYAPTNESMKLTSDMLNTDWSEKAFTDNLKLLKTDAQIRLNSLGTGGVVTVNPTTGQVEGGASTGKDVSVDDAKSKYGISY